MSLEEESFYFNFINTNQNNINVDFIKSSIENPIILDENNSEEIYSKDNFPYEFKNLYDYKFIITNLNKEQLKTLNTINITSNKDYIYITLDYNEDDYYLECTISIIAENNFYSESDHTANIYINLQ